MKRNPQEKFVVLYDTAKKCLLILDCLYCDFQNGTNKAIDAELVNNDPSIVTRTYISALGLIDYFHRFHEIVSALPLIRKDQPELQELRRVLEPVKDCRNYLQHMRNDLMKGESIGYPILGAISWLHEDRSYTLLSNQPTHGISQHGIVYDLFEGKYICKYQLVVGGHEVRIDTVYNEIKSFWAWLEKSVVIQPPSVKDYAWGKPMIMCTWLEFEKP